VDVDHFIMWITASWSIGRKPKLSDSADATARPQRKATQLASGVRPRVATPLFRVPCKSQLPPPRSAARRRPPDRFPNRENKKMLMARGMGFLETHYTAVGAEAAPCLYPETILGRGQGRAS
jgi:hypothetical protein